MPFTFVYFTYNRIRQTALSEGLFTIAAYSVGILDVPNRTTSPYDAYPFFTFAPFTTEITRFNSIPFTLPDALFQMPGINSVQVDFDDGGGYRTLNRGGVPPIPKSYCTILCNRSINRRYLLVSSKNGACLLY